MDEKFLKIVYEQLIRRASQFSTENYSEILEKRLLEAVRVEHPEADTTILREAVRELKRQNSIKLAGGDAGFPDDEHNYSYRYKISQTPEDNFYHFPHKLDSGTTWESMILKFLDDENVSIQIGRFKYDANYSQMGFKDKRSSKPNQQWTLLLILSKRAGRIDWNSSEAQEKFKKWKERLTKSLRNYFAIDYDPFKPYKLEKGYEIKITLIPPPQLEEDEKKHQSREEEIAELFKEQTEDDKSF